MAVMKPRVYITVPFPAPAVQRIRECCDLDVWHGEGAAETPREILLDLVPNLDGLIVDSDKVDAELMDKASKLKIVCEYGVGYDNINVAEATSRGIVVANTPGVLSDSVADFVFALLLAAARRMMEANASVQAGTWGSNIQFGQDVHGATLGIIGLGRIGKSVATRAKGFGMKLLYYDIVRQKQAEEEFGIRYVELEELLTQSDFITIHTNLVPETFHLIGARELDKMKRTSILVNTSRGPVVDNSALYSALREGKILAAALDVTEPEPLPRDHPLLTLKNVIVTPHIASATEPARISIAMMAVDNLFAGLSGKIPPGAVNPEVLTSRKQVSEKRAK